MSKSSNKRTVTLINEQIKKLDNAGQVSDGYHTFDELYDHRITLFIALINLLSNMYEYDVPYTWKSKKHSDGSSWDGWFIAGIGIKIGEQVTYHIPIERWDEVKTNTLKKAPDFDGHTPADVIERIKKYLY